MSLKTIIPLICAFVVFGYISLANEAAVEEKAEKVDFYAIPVVKVQGKAISVSHSLKDEDKKPSRKFLGKPTVIFKQDGKVVHEGAMKPG